MSTTIPALNDVSDILDTDMCIVTHSNGDSYKISGAEINKRNQAVIAPAATPTVLTGAPLKTGNIVRVYWTVDLTANNGATPLALTYNNVSKNVKVPRNGALENFLAFDLGSGVYKYLQAYTTLELLYDGTNFIVLGNPVLISDSDFTISADGKKVLTTVNTVASGNMHSVTSNAVNAELTNKCTTQNINNARQNGVLRNRVDEEIVSINAYDDSNTGFAIDFDYNHSRIRIYKVVNGEGQGYKDAVLS